MPVRDKLGTMITSDEEQEQRWKEHFEDILNGPDPNSRADIPDANRGTIKIRKSHSNQEFKNNKALGNDKLPAKIFKADPILASFILISARY
jgi:hypothetical protein